MNTEYNHEIINENLDFESEQSLDEKNEDEIFDDYETDNLTPELIRQVVSFTTDWTVETLVGQIKKKNISLSPKFQRRNVWNNKDKSLFIESLMLNIPVPNILLGEDINHKGGKYLVIDGKQRLLTIAEFYGLDIDVENQSRKPFRRLTGLNILKDLNGFSYKDLENKQVSAKDVMDNYSVRNSIMRNIPNEAFLYEIFKRINTGSESLSPQELRQSRFPGKFLDFLDEKSVAHEINALLNLKQLKHPRMRDTELLLRAFSFKFRLPSYNNSISGFLDDACKFLNSDWNRNSETYVAFFDQLVESIRFVNKIFESNAFSLIGLNREKSGFNRPVFDLMTYFLSIENNRKKILLSDKNLPTLFEAYINEDRAFSYTLTVNTHQTLHTRIRFKLFYDFLMTNYDIEEDKFLSNIEFDEVQKIRLTIPEDF